MSDPLLQIFSDVLEMPVEDLNDETSPGNTSKWDSLAVMHLVVAIETKFNVHLSTQDISGMDSIGNARAVLKEKNAAL